MSDTSVPSELLSAMAEAIMGNLAGIATLLATHVDDGTVHAAAVRSVRNAATPPGPAYCARPATLAAERSYRTGRTLESLPITRR